MNTQSEIVNTVWGTLCGLPASESPLDSTLHARFMHRAIAHIVRLALQEQPYFEETCTGAMEFPGRTDAVR